MLVCPQPVKNMPPARAARPVHGPSVGSRTGVVLEWRCVGVDLVHLQFCIVVGGTFRPTTVLGPWWGVGAGAGSCSKYGAEFNTEKIRTLCRVRTLGPRAPRASSALPPDTGQRGAAKDRGGGGRTGAAVRAPAS